MANEKQSTDKVIQRRAELHHCLRDGQNLYCFTIRRPHDEQIEIVFRNNSELCEAIEVLCRALRDAVDGKRLSVNYQSEPISMECQMVRI